MLSSFARWVESLVDRFAERIATHLASVIADAVSRQLAETLPRSVETSVRSMLVPRALRNLWWSLYAPPEVTSALIYSGPGAASLTRSASSWRQLAVELHAAQQSVAAVVAGIPWTGSAAATMQTTMAGYVSALAALAGTAATAGQAASAAAAAFQQAHVSVAAPAHIAANRQLTVSLTAANMLGQYSQAIALLEAAYEQMWAQDVAAMSVYSTQSTAATNMLTGAPSPQSVATPTTATTSNGVDLSPDGWVGQLVLSTLSSGPYQMPTEVLALMTGLWAASSVSAMPDILNRVRNIIDMPAGVAPAIPAASAPPVSVGVGGAPRVGALAVPPAWAQTVQPAAEPRGVAPAQGRPGPMPIPLPLPNINGRTPAQHAAAQPRYGDEPKVMPKHPAGG